jgi:hypothetical protein
MSEREVRVIDRLYPVLIILLFSGLIPIGSAAMATIVISYFVERLVCIVVVFWFVIVSLSNNAFYWLTYNLARREYVRVKRFTPQWRERKDYVLERLEGRRTKLATFILLNIALFFFFFGLYFALNLLSDPTLFIFAAAVGVITLMLFYAPNVLVEGGFRRKIIGNIKCAFE